MKLPGGSRFFKMVFHSVGYIRSFSGGQGVGEERETLYSPKEISLLFPTAPSIGTTESRATWAFSPSFLASQGCTLRRSP